MTNLLMILDGFGYNPESYGNAVEAAKMPYVKGLFAQYPHTLIDASGLAVGLPEGQMGNSEVGHMNMGAGRVVYQELTRITKSIEDGDFFTNPVLCRAMDRCADGSKSLHLLGLLSDGGVHSHMDHIKALLRMAKERRVERVYLHAFLDGRDVPPTSAVQYLNEIQAYMEQIGCGRLGSMAGRYYPMDRDKRWDRVEKGYDCLTCGTTFYEDAKGCKDAEAIMKAAYAKGDVDEFLLPVFLGSDPRATVQDGDSMIFFDFRPDRMRQIVRSFANEDFETFGFARKAVRKDLYIASMTRYDATIPNVHVVFPQQQLDNTFGAYVSKQGRTQLRIAETEKYAHVTFFFNGGIEHSNEGEDRILVPSPKVATYDLQPEMSAPEVAQKAAEAITGRKYDFVILNFANPDMVGHTGDFKAVVKALEILDNCVKQVTEALQSVGGNMILTADHGNCDVMLDKDGNVVTSHSTNQVPLLVMAAGAEYRAASGKESMEDQAAIDDMACDAARYPLRTGGALCDVVPTLLQLAGMEQPAEMTGHSLLR